jgi:hypothetical protein
MRQGRPRVERDPNERVPMSTRIRGELFNKLSEAAARHDRPLGHEVEQRLEASFAAESDHLFPIELRHMALMLIGHYTMSGAGGTAELLLRLADPTTLKLPDKIQQRERAAQMIRRIISNLPALAEDDAAARMEEEVKE